MEPKGLLLYSQQPATCMCPDLYESCPHYLSCFFLRSILILSSGMSVLSKDSWLKLYMNYFSNLHMLYALSMIFSSIWSTLIINGVEYESLSSFLCYFVQISLSSFLIGSHLPQHPFLQHLDRTRMLRWKSWVCPYTCHEGIQVE